MVICSMLLISVSNALNFDLFVRYLVNVLPHYVHFTFANSRLDGPLVAVDYIMQQLLSTGE